MKNLIGKKLLVLGGKPIGSKEIVLRAKELGVYTIVTDYFPAKNSPAKLVANESWNISTADTETLAMRAKEAKVDGIYTGVHEFNIKQMIKLCSLLNLPCFCTMDQWDALENKKNFKEACRDNNIPVTKEYIMHAGVDYSLNKIDFPVIVKPADGSGSMGFSICNNDTDLSDALLKAKSFSPTGDVLVESLMDYRYSTIINYTIVGDQIIYSGMSDKRSKKVFESGAPIMAFQTYPSEYEEEYLQSLNEKTIKMLSSFGLKNGVVWIEAFCKDGQFHFNELGYRFGGSLTYYPVSYYYGIDQLNIQLEYALTGANDPVNFVESPDTQIYCILPTHVKPGKIGNIEGLDMLEGKEYLKAYVPVHNVGDQIQDWGTAQQVLAYIHFVVKEREEIKDIQREIMSILHVKDESGKEMLFNLYDDSFM